MAEPLRRIRRREVWKKGQELELDKLLFYVKLKKEKIGFTVLFKKRTPFSRICVEFILLNRRGNEEVVVDERVCMFYVQ